MATVKTEFTQINGIKVKARHGFSDMKTYKEVIGNRVYERKGFKIQTGSTWMDCGGNVGAFCLFAASKGANVVTYEPDPFNCQLIEDNLKLNGWMDRVEIKQAALVCGDQKEAILSIGTNGNVWRNSLVKRWNSGKAIKVPCLNFDNEASKFRQCKMDIEGSEMPILESTKIVFDRLVYEWSFDIDPSLPRFWNIIEQQSSFYDLKFPVSSTRFEKRDYIEWQPSWFPACVNVFAWKKP